MYQSRLAILVFLSMMLYSCSVPKYELRAGEYLMELPHLGVESRIFIKSDYQWVHSLKIRKTDGLFEYFSETGTAKLEENSSGYRLLHFGKLSKCYDPLKTKAATTYKPRIQWENIEMYVMLDALELDSEYGYTYKWVSSSVNPAGQTQ